MNRKIFHNSKLKATFTLCIVAIIMVITSGCSTPRMGVKPISAMPETFWPNNNTVQVSVSVGAIKMGDIKGKIDKSETVLKGVFTGGVGLLLSGFPRYEDEKFRPYVQELLQLRKFYPHKFALKSVRQKLSLPSNLKPYFKSEGSWYSYQLDDRASKSSLPVRDTYITVSIHLWFEDTTSDLSLSESSVRLRGRIHYSIMDEKTRQRIHQSDPPKTAWSDYLDGTYGTYNDSPTVKTESYPKSTWLSDDGRFLQKRISHIIEQLVSQACKDINTSFGVKP